MFTPPTKFFDSYALKERIELEIHLYGPNCDLNHLDVGSIEIFFEIFSGSTASFNGDISRWDVCNAYDMARMFSGSSFNGDLSSWNPIRVERMSSMFEYSKFNGDISKWRMPKLRDTSCMFQGSVFNGNLSEWTFESLLYAGHMFDDCPFAGDASRWDLKCLPLYPVSMFMPTFDGVLPRLGRNGIERRAFYRHVLNTLSNSKGLAMYLKKQPFGSVHLDIAMTAHQKPNGISQEDYQWIKHVQSTGISLGLNDRELLDYALAQYQERSPVSWTSVDFGAVT